MRQRTRSRKLRAKTSTDVGELIRDAIEEWLADGPLLATATPSSHSPQHNRFRGKSRKSLALIDAATTVLQEIQPASIRAVCYRLFTLGLISSMSKGETNRVSSQLTWARENRLIPWSWVVDETRAPERVSAWSDPAAFIETVQRAYRRDRWTDQPSWIEVWSEKGTIRGTVAPILNTYGVTFRVMHGYGSATAVHQIAQETQQTGKPLTVLYVGDWDPSGLHMSEIDLPSRLARYEGKATIVRMALTPFDTQGGLPSFSLETKTRDPRYRWFRDRFGTRCWELDALSPVILRDRIEHAIVEHIEPEAWQRADIAEQAESESLATILNAWPGVLRVDSKSGPA